MGARKTARPLGRGMAALMVVVSVLQIRPATGAPGDIFSIPAPAIAADPPKATDIKDGDASVSTQTGALQYSYPIQMPPGRNGMVPQLALSYSSQAPTYGGIASGWTLSVPIITEDRSEGRLRTRSNQVEIAQAFAGKDPKPDDRFVSSMAGGRPLVLVTEPTGVASDVYAAYRAQNDSSFTRYERMQSYAPYRWRARTSEGNVLTFGEASRMQGCTASDQYAPLTGMADAFGNEVRYDYNQTVPGECKLMRITWGQNPGAGLADFAQVNLKYKVGNYCNGVYTNSQTDYRSGSRILSGASKLVEIKATAYSPGAATSAPVHTRTISLQYDELAETCQQSHAPVRLLKSIQERAVGTDSPQVVLPPVTFDYNPATVTMWWPPQGSPKPVPWFGASNLGWGYRGGEWPTVEMMFLDIDGDGLQDVVENASGSIQTECVARWKKNLGTDASGNLHFASPSPPLEELIALPRLKWKGSASPWPVAGASQADPTSGERCALNGQATAFRNAYALSNACHHAPGSPCRPGKDPGDPVQYCEPGGTRCPQDPGGPWGGGDEFVTQLAYRWLDMDADGLVDLVAAIHGDIDSYDIERGNKIVPFDFTAGEPSMSGIPGLDTWPACPGQLGPRCHRLEHCLDEHSARTCDGLGCISDWADVLTCVASTPTLGCANVLAKPAGGPEGQPNPGTVRHPYERCEGMYPWLIYKNNGRGQFATAPIIKYQPVPLESASGDSSLNSPIGMTSENHAIIDFDGDGFLDAVVRETDSTMNGWTGSFAWQVWPGDGTGGFSPRSYMFLTRTMNACSGAGCFGENALSATGGTWGSDVVSLAGLLDANGDGAQDHWLALPNGNADIAFNNGEELKLIAPAPGVGEMTTPNTPPYRVRPGNDTHVTPIDPALVVPGATIRAGTTTAVNRVVDVDGDGRVDIVSFDTVTAAVVPKVFFNVGGQFIAPGVDYPFNNYPAVTLAGLKRNTEARQGGIWQLNSDLIDLDGDGLQEGVSFSPTDGFVRVQPELTQPPRLLSTVDNGRGAKSTINYAQMHDTSVVEQNPDELWPDGRPKASPRAQWVVKSMQVHDALASIDAVTQYHYKNPRFAADDDRHYSFRGFEEVTATKPGPSGAADGSRRIQRYGYDVDWSGRLVETVVMPSVAEASSEGATNIARTIDKTTWQELPLFAGKIKTYHAAGSEHFTCANGQQETTCQIGPAGYTRTTTSYTAYPDTPTPGDEQLWAESGSLLQANATPSDGDRQTLTTYLMSSSAGVYLLRPSDVEQQHRSSGAMVTYAKSRKTWGYWTGEQVTDEVWVDSDDAHRMITRYYHDPQTGNRLWIWKPVQWAANPNAITNLNRTTLDYDTRKLFVAKETNERGHVREYLYEYGNGTKLETVGPNAPPCAGTNNCTQGQPVKEDHRIRVDGMGRMIERFETYASPGSNYLNFKVETNAYVDGPAASVTHQAAIDFDNNFNVRYTEDSTDLDGHGRPIKKTVFVFGSAPADHITSFVYRADGTIAEVKLPNPMANDASIVSYTYTFDSLGRPLTIRRPDAAVLGERSGINLSYDGVTQLSKEVVGASGGQPAATKTTKDSFGRLVQVDEQLTGGPTPTWATTHYEYDAANNIERIVDAENVTTSVAHDFAGHRTRITRVGRTWIYSYDKNGNLLTETSPCEGLGCEATHTTSIAYDVLNRPTSKFIAPRELVPEDVALFGADHETYTYDVGYNAVGRLASWKSFGSTSATTPTLQSDHQYTAAGQSSWQKQTTNAADYSGLQRTVFSRYHISGEISDTFFYDIVGKQNCQNGSMAAYWYDARGLPFQVQVQNCVYGPTAYSYMRNKRNVAGLVTKRYSIAGNTPITDVESNWGYDTLSRVTSQIVNKGTALEQVARQDLSYYGNDDPKTLDHWLGMSNPKHFSFQYDERHQLIDVAEAGNAFNATYVYGDAGRFTHAFEDAASLPGSNVKPRDVEYQYAGVDPEQVTALVDGTSTYASYTYDLAGNQTNRTFSTTGESWDYVYDGENRLRRVTRTLNGTVTGSEEYWYDSAGKRNHVVKRDAAGDKTEMIWFMRGDVEAHYDANGTVTKVYGHVGMGTPVFRLERNSDAAAAVEYQFHGLASNTLAAVDQATGTVNASFTYAPFGEIIEATDGGGVVEAGIEMHRRRMNDKFVDEIGGLAYYGFRYYDNTLMNWTQSDPLYRFSPDAAWTQPRHASLYTMSLQNPLRYIDPDGRSGDSIAIDAGKAAGTAVTVSGAASGGTMTAVIVETAATVGVIGIVALGLGAAALAASQAAPDAPGIPVKYEAAYDRAQMRRAREQERKDRAEAQASYDRTIQAYKDGIAKGRTDAMKADNAASKDKAPAKSAEIHPGKGDQAGEDLSVDDAVDCVRCGNDVIAKDKKTARDIATKAGNGPPAHDAAHRPNERPHYHPTDENGNRIDDTGHVMY